MLRRPLIISGAPLNAMSSLSWGTVVVAKAPEEVEEALPMVPSATARFHSASV